jgi:hypothetical protein
LRPFSSPCTETIPGPPRRRPERLRGNMCSLRTPRTDQGAAHRTPPGRLPFNCSRSLKAPTRYCPSHASEHSPPTAGVPLSRTAIPGQTYGGTTGPPARSKDRP